MRITMGKFDENGEIVWFDVESDDYKTPEEKNQNVGYGCLSQQSDTDGSRGGSTKSNA